MIDKVDLVMWTKNGAQTLPAVLHRINEVIPQEFVNKKIVADDASSDGTQRIASSFGWSVIPNKGHGISDGANTALEVVTSNVFISFEQDLLLTFDWWQKIPPLLENSKVAIASGMRYADKPVGVKKMQEYVGRKYRGEANLTSWLKSRDMSAFTLGKTLDNTIYKTKIIKQLGGFPKLRVNAGVDTTLAYKVDHAGYRWAVEYNVRSVHIRKGLKQELDHQYWYGAQLYEIWRKIETETTKPPPVTRLGVIRRFVISPFTGFFMAVQTKEPSVLYIHPLIRFYYMKGLLQTSKTQKQDSSQSMPLIKGKINGAGVQNNHD
jgi:glycosyltransferase involved in cell wall biosynthesis